MISLVNLIFWYCLIHFIIFISAFWAKPKPLKYVGIALAVSSFGYRWLTSHGFSDFDHSKANVQLCGMIFTVMLVVTIWTFSAWKSWKVSKGCLGIYLAVWFTIWFSIYWTKIARSCVHLQDSIHPDVKYSEEGGECKWVKAKVCWDYTFEGAMSPLFWGQDKCSNIEDNLTMHRK